jgi:hypothetical protein
MAPPIVTATVQTAIISALSNILAQALTAHQTNVRLSPPPLSTNIPLTPYHRPPS